MWCDLREHSQWRWCTSKSWRRISSWHPGKDSVKGSPILCPSPKDRHSLTHNSKGPLSCQWSSRDRSNYELTSWWMRLYTFWIIGKKCQNSGEGKQKRGIAVRTISDSAYERGHWSPLMTFLWHLTFFFCLCREGYVISAGNCTNTVSVSIPSLGKLCQRKT